MSALEFCVLASVIHCIYDTHGGTLKSHNHMKITTTIDIPEETVLDQCADGRLIQWPVEFVIQDRCDAHSWYAIAEKELNEK